PLFNGLRVVPGVPDTVQVGFDEGLYGDLHCGLLGRLGVSRISRVHSIRIDTHSISVRAGLDEPRAVRCLPPSRVAPAGETDARVDEGKGRDRQPTGGAGGSGAARRGAGWLGFAAGVTRRE